MSVVLYSYTLCVLVLFGKMLAISCYKGFYRIGRMTFKNAEDARLVGRAASAEELPQVARASQAWSNDLENIPLFFVLGGLYAVLDGPAGPAPWLFGAFTVARIMHTVTYLGRWQPWRTLSYAVGTICLLWLAGLIITHLVTSSR